MKTELTQEEKDRLIEVLLFLYFNKMSNENLESSVFWNMIRNICILNKINDLAILKAMRILLADENVPKEDEMCYLLQKFGLSVRPIRTISGIYWQKQKVYTEQFKTSTPTVTRRILDPVIRNSMFKFIKALYEILGIFSRVDVELLDNL